MKLIYKSVQTSQDSELIINLKGMVVIRVLSR